MHHPTRSIASFAVAAVAALAAAGCGHEAKPPRGEAAIATTTTAANPTPQNGSLRIAQDIRDLCNIHEEANTPHFDYNSNELSPGERNVLQQLATCMTTGPLKGKDVRLVGRADPRGEAEYNMNLGEARATTVRKYLASLGVAPTRLDETSRGALDATGHDEDGWRKDRRVDIALR